MAEEEMDEQPAEEPEPYTRRQQLGLYLATLKWKQRILAEIPPRGRPIEWAVLDIAVSELEAEIEATPEDEPARRESWR